MWKINPLSRKKTARSVHGKSSLPFLKPVNLIQIVGKWALCLELFLAALSAGDEVVASVWSQNSYQWIERKPHDVAVTRLLKELLNLYKHNTMRSCDHLRSICAFCIHLSLLPSFAYTWLTQFGSVPTVVAVNNIPEYPAGLRYCVDRSNLYPLMCRTSLVWSRIGGLAVGYMSACSNLQCLNAAACNVLEVR